MRKIVLASLIAFLLCTQVTYAMTIHDRLAWGGDGGGVDGGDGGDGGGGEN